MKHLKFAFTLGRFAILATVLCVGGCYEEVVPSLKTINDLEDIPYDAVGSGKLVFTRNSTVYIIDSDKRTSWGLGVDLMDAMISPDGALIAYAKSQNVNDPTEIFTVDVQNNNTSQISFSSSYCSRPSWMPDSKHIVFEEYVSGLRRVLNSTTVHAPESSIVKIFYYMNTFGSKVSVSQNNNLVFSLSEFIPGENYYAKLFTMQINGTNLKQITSRDSLYGDSPVWSPSGDQIATIKSKRNTSPTGGLEILSTEVILMDQNGKNVKSLIKLPAAPDHQWLFGPPASVSWSPDGTKLAFNLYDGEGLHIYLINADGTGLTKLTSEVGAIDAQLSWSR